VGWVGAPNEQTGDGRWARPNVSWDQLRRHRDVKGFADDLYDTYLDELRLEGLI
jgi:hypothetical protein